MRIYTRGDVPSPDRGSSLTIGMFDGVHLGHQVLIRRAAESGRRHGLPVGLVTFDPHPTEVICPEAAPPLLTTLAERLRLLRQLDLLDFVVVLPFDAVRRSETPEAFVQGMLLERLRARFVTVGSDFRFGHRRAGDVDRLVALGVAGGFETAAVSPVLDGESGERISSTSVRRAFAAGDLALTEGLLGRRHEVLGVARQSSALEALAPANLTVDVDPRLCLPPSGPLWGWCAVGARRPQRALITASVGRRSACDTEVRPTDLEARVTFCDPMADSAPGTSPRAGRRDGLLHLDLQRSA